MTKNEEEQARKLSRARILRRMIEALQEAPDGDERIVGDALNLYAKAVPDEEVEETVKSTLNNLIDILARIKEALD